MFKKMLSLSLSLSLLVGTTIPSSRAESLQSPTQQVISEKSSESKNSKDYYKKYKDIKKQYKKLSNKNQPGGWSNVIKHPFNIIFNSELYMFFGAIISGSIFDGYPTLCAALTAASGIYGGISEAKKFYKSN